MSYKDATRELSVGIHANYLFGIRELLMKPRSTLVLALMLVCGTSFGTEHYTEARITQVDASDAGIVFFLQVVSGDTPPVGNGGSNEPVSKSFLALANTPETIASRKHLLSAAFVAMSAGTIVRFRWDDAGPYPGWILVMLVRS